MSRWQNCRNKWSDHEHATLLAMLKEGKNYDEITEALPGRKKHSITLRVHVKGLHYSGGRGKCPSDNQYRREIALAAADEGITPEEALDMKKRNASVRARRRAFRSLYAKGYKSPALSFVSGIDRHTVWQYINHERKQERAP